MVSGTSSYRAEFVHSTKNVKISNCKFAIRVSFVWWSSNCLTEKMTCTRAFALLVLHGCPGAEPYNVRKFDCSLSAGIVSLNIRGTDLSRAVAVLAGRQVPKLGS